MFNYERRKAIKKLLIDADLHQADIARAAGVTVTAISDALKCRLKSRRLRDAIAAALKMPVGQIWPDEPGDRAA